MQHLVSVTPKEKCIWAANELMDFAAPDQRQVRSRLVSLTTLVQPSQLPRSKYTFFREDNNFVLGCVYMYVN